VLGDSKERLAASHSERMGGPEKFRPRPARSLDLGDAAAWARVGTAVDKTLHDSIR
jgi:hypothetical protein